LPGSRSPAKRTQTGIYSRCNRAQARGVRHTLQSLWQQRDICTCIYKLCIYIPLDTPCNPMCPDSPRLDKPPLPVRNTKFMHRLFVYQVYRYKTGEKRAKNGRAPPVAAANPSPARGTPLRLVVCIVHAHHKCTVLPYKYSICTVHLAQPSR
jgi:hypothetical protein